jgi:hypothetical protein
MSHVPPKAHLRKARKRLERLESLLQPEDLAVGKARLPEVTVRREYAMNLAIVLNDYDRILEGLEDDE